MATNPHPAWTIYATQLFPQGYGYPLWQPEPDPSAAREVDVGDVGWTADGGFFQLFNARTKEKERQMYADVPEDFVPFDPPNLVVSGPNKSETAIPPLCSQTIEAFAGSGSAQATPAAVPLASAGGSFSFKCRDDQGAILMFSPAAYATKIRSKRHIINYMRAHAASWVEFSDKFGLDLKEHDILFICGTTKTARWAVTAFQGNCKEKEGTISVDLGAVARLNVSINISDHSLPQTHRKVGPSRAPPTDASPLNEWEEPNDQCLFIHYYQMMRRTLWFRQFKAAGGPHELPPPGRDGAALGVLVSATDDDGNFEFQQTTSTQKPFDPVKHLLHYILANSEASLAIASDLDLYDLFRNQDFPVDIPAALASLRPQVEVDQDGVGTVSSYINFGKQTTVDDETENAQGTVDSTPSSSENALPETAHNSVERNPSSRGVDNDDDIDDNTSVTQCTPDVQPTVVREGFLTAPVYHMDAFDDPSRQAQLRIPPSSDQMPILPNTTTDSHPIVHEKWVSTLSRCTTSVRRRTRPQDAVLETLGYHARRDLPFRTWAITRFTFSLMLALPQIVAICTTPARLLDFSGPGFVVVTAYDSCSPLVLWNIFWLMKLLIQCYTDIWFFLRRLKLRGEPVEGPPAIRPSSHATIMSLITFCEAGLVSIWIPVQIIVLMKHGEQCYLYAPRTAILASVILTLAIVYYLPTSSLLAIRRSRELRLTRSLGSDDMKPLLQHEADRVPDVDDTVPATPVQGVVY